MKSFLRIIAIAKDPLFGDEGVMRNMNRAILMLCLLAAGGLGAVSARAVGPEVRDSAGIFSASAVKQADETIRKIQREFRKDLLVETFAGVPENRTADYTRNREEFFANFVSERAQSSRLDGIYVVVMKEPPPHRYRIQVGVGQATRQRAFVTSDRDDLVKLLQSSFREDKYDEGLRAGIAFVERTLRNNLHSGSTIQGSSTRQTAPTSSSSSNNSMGSFLILGLFLVGGIFVVSFIMRLMRGGMGGGGLPGAGGLGGGGGGGFLTSLLGGVGGAIAGSWLYDRFLGGNAHASDSYNANPSDAPSSDVGGDWSSSGGDADSSSGGGDFGGGGDSGGGGGDA